MKYHALVAVFFLAGCPKDETPIPNVDVGADGAVVIDVGSDLNTNDSSGEPDEGTQEDMPNTELRDEALLQSLRDAAIETMRPLGYNLARDNMYTFGGIEDQNGRVECVYTGRTVDVDNTRTPSVNCQLADGTPTNCTFNTEHTLARIHLRAALTEGTSEYDAAEGDLHHLFPSDEEANNSRANFDFGETECNDMNNCRFDEESFLGIHIGEQGSTTCPMDAPCVMEVRAERRGDVARALFYMAMRYDLDIPTDSEAEVKLWHEQDPPDDYERGRNARVETAQGNRNPFIEQPELVDRISDF